MRKSVSARRATKTAKAEAKRAARAQAKAVKEAEDEKKKALVGVKASEVAKLVAELKLLVDNACDHFASQMREAAELTSRLRDDFGLTQFKIGAAIGRSQAWVSMILKWKEAGYPQTAFGPQSKARDVRRLSGPDNSELPAPPKAPDSQVGMPPGPKRTLLPNNMITVANSSVGNAGDPVAEGEVMKAKLAALDTPLTSESSDTAEAPAPTAPSREEISDDALTAAKKFWWQQIADKISEDDWRKYRIFISDEKQCMPPGWRTRMVA
jgi:hypothetical protein